jgi:SAM-dependent methyltransferase
MRAASLLRPGAALDLACGLGRHSFLLAENGWRVTAVDYSEAALNFFREQSRRRRLPINIVRADLEAGEFHIEAGGYDLICDFCYLQRSLFPEIYHGLRPGGIFVAVLRFGHGMSYAVKPGELQAAFDDWEILHAFEGHGRAELIARKPSAA